MAICLAAGILRSRAKSSTLERESVPNTRNTAARRVPVKFRDFKPIVVLLGWENTQKRIPRAKIGVEITLIL